MDLGLGNKNVLVTGASMGMGAAFAVAFAQEGASVYINYIVDKVGAEKFACELVKKFKVYAQAVYGDVSKEEDVKAMFESIEKLDVLVNNAGIWPHTNFMDMPFEEWKKVMSVNLDGAFLCSKYACKKFIEQNNGGHIVNIGSKSGVSCSSGGHAHYVASKGGLVMLTKALAREVSKDGIVVNCIIPGMVETPLNEKERNDPKMMEYYTKRLPMGRFSKPEDIANAVVFMASEKATFTAGSIMDVTGGLLL